MKAGIASVVEEQKKLKTEGVDGNSNDVATLKASFESFKSEVIAELKKSKTTDVDTTHKISTTDVDTTNEIASLKANI